MFFVVERWNFQSLAVDLDSQSSLQVHSKITCVWNASPYINNKYFSFLMKIKKVPRLVYTLEVILILILHFLKKYSIAKQDKHVSKGNAWSFQRLLCEWVCFLLVQVTGLLWSPVTSSKFRPPNQLLSKLEISSSESGLGKVWLKDS